MQPNSLKNIPIVLFFLFTFGARVPADAVNYSFTSIDATQGLSDNQIRYILQLPDGRMVFTTSGNVNIYDGAHFTYLHRTAEHVYPLKQYDGFYRIYRSGDSLLWIKDTHKLMCIHLYKEQYISPPDAYFRHRKIHTPVEDLFVDNSGNTWVLGKGKLRELSSGVCIPLPDDGHKRLQDVASDNRKIYLFYHTGEVDCYDADQQKVLYRRAAYPKEEQENFHRTSLVVKSKNGFYQLRNGRNKGGFFYFNPHRRTWKKLFEQNYPLNTLIVTPDSREAYISCAHGFWQIELTTGARHYFPVLETGEGKLISTEISTLFQDRQGGLWIGTLNRGLLYHHPAMRKLTRVGRRYFPVSQEEDLNVTAFTEDKNGIIHIQTNTGTYRLTFTKEKKPVLRQVPASTISFPSPAMTGQYTDTRGRRWEATADGLKLQKDNTCPPLIFYREDGLSNNFIQAIIEDHRHDIWVTTSNGISRIHISGESDKIGFTNFNRLDGALEGEYTKGAIFKSSDGTLYFGGVDGFNIFHPDEERATPGLPYKPVLTNLRLHGETVRTGQKYGNRIILPQTPPYTETLEFDYNQNFLTFEFSALNYINNERSYYRYQLEGIDKQWVNAFANRQNSATADNGILQASYTNLPPGRYTLKVAASDNIFLWNKHVTSIQVIIHAPWWKTTTAYILYTVFFLLSILTGIRLYIYRARKRMERQHKEEILLLRIRHLIEQCNSYEAEQKARSDSKNCSPEEEETYTCSLDSRQSDTAESAFLSQAIELVEKNLHVSGYSVEQLSRDLCMERTGLYRKLVTLLDQSPSLFIRNIRLQRAAQLLLEGKLTVTEIAERTGFSSSSYLSKCFQEMYGCRPSEYAEKMKKST